MTFLFQTSVLLLAVAVPLRQGDAVRFAGLPRDQRAHVESLVTRLTANCCVRKPAVIRLRDDIAQRIRDGRADSEILAEFAGRFPPDLPDQETGNGSLTAGLSVSAIVGAAVVTTLRRRRAKDPEEGNAACPDQAGSPGPVIRHHATREPELLAGTFKTLSR